MLNQVGERLRKAIFGENKYIFFQSLNIKGLLDVGENQFPSSVWGEKIPIMVPTLGKLYMKVYKRGNQYFICSRIEGRSSLQIVCYL